MIDLLLSLTLIASSPKQGQNVWVLQYRWGNSTTYETQTFISGDTCDSAANRLFKLGYEITKWCEQA